MASVFATTSAKMQAAGSPAFAATHAAGREAFMSATTALISDPYEYPVALSLYARKMPESGSAVTRTGGGSAARQESAWR